jgi:heptosyltransferase-2
MSTPALAQLRHAKPAAHIALLTHEKLADLWRHHPAIDEIIPFSARDGIGAVARQLRQRKFQTALIFPNSFRSAFEPWLAGIPDRVAYTGNGRAVLLTQKVPRHPDEARMHKRTVSEVKALVEKTPDKPRDTYPLTAHHIHHYLHLTGAIGANTTPVAPQIHVTPAEIEQFRRGWELPYSKDLVIGLNPGAEYGPAKRWPIDRFIETVRQLRKSVSATFLIFGGKNDRFIAHQLESALRVTQMKILNLAGQTSLRELCAGLSLCDLLLTNDTGPMHLAAALGTRVVVPFGSTSPELTGPGLPGISPHQLLLGQAPCAPCFLRECPIDFRCMKSIAVEEVLRETRNLLEKDR